MVITPGRLRGETRLCLCFTTSQIKSVCTETPSTQFWFVCDYLLFDQKLEANQYVQFLSCLTHQPASHKMFIPHGHSLSCNGLRLQYIMHAERLHQY